MRVKRLLNGKQEILCSGMPTTTSGLFRGVQVGLLLGLADVFLVADALVAEPVGNLR